MTEPWDGDDNGRTNRNDEPDDRNPYTDDRSWRAPGQEGSDWNGDRFPSGGGYGWGAGYGSSGFNGWSEPQSPVGPQGQQGQSFAGRGPKNYQRSDERIREEISDRFTDDHQLDAWEITVQVQNSVVTLSGTVINREQKRRAEDLAESVSGVKDVTNHIRVDRRQAGSERGHWSNQPTQVTPLAGE